MRLTLRRSPSSFTQEELLDPDCYIYNLKLNAWQGTSGAYTSDVKQATVFTLSTAIKFCKSRWDSGGMCFPVRVEDISAVMVK